MNEVNSGQGLLHWQSQQQLQQLQQVIHDVPQQYSHK